MAELGDYLNTNEFPKSSNRNLFSGPVVVSMIGNAGWTERKFKVPKDRKIDTTKDVI